MPYSKFNGADANIFFALKAYLKEWPKVLLSIAICSSVFILGLAIRTWERPYMSGNFEYVMNSFWLAIVTMATSKPNPLNNLF